MSSENKYTASLARATAALAKGQLEGKPKFSVVGHADNGELTIVIGSRVIGGAQAQWKKNPNYIFVPVAALAGDRADVMNFLVAAGYGAIASNLDNYAVTQENHDNSSSNIVIGGTLVNGGVSGQMYGTAASLMAGMTTRSKGTTITYAQARAELDRLEAPFVNAVLQARAASKSKKASSPARGVVGAAGTGRSTFVEKYNKGGLLLQVNKLTSSGAGSTVGKELKQADRSTRYMLPGLRGVYVSAQRQTSSKAGPIEEDAHTLAQGALNAYNLLNIPAPSSLEQDIAAHIRSINANKAASAAKKAGKVGGKAGKPSARQASPTGNSRVDLTSFAAAPARSSSPRSSSARSSSAAGPSRTSSPRSPPRSPSVRSSSGAGPSSARVSAPRVSARVSAPRTPSPRNTSPARVSAPRSPSPSQTQAPRATAAASRLAGLAGARRPAANN
jgi:hypothetical protein